MKNTGDDKFQNAIHDLEHALQFTDKVDEDPIYFSGIAKSFEVCVEYAWKYFKRRALEENLDPYSPTKS